MKTRVKTERNGVLLLNIPPGGIPALRLVQYHASEIRFELTDEAGTAFLIPLGEISLKHDVMASLNGSTTAAPTR